MKILIFFIFFILISYNSYATNIAVFQYSLILDNSNQYKEFQKELNIFKEKTYNDLKKEEEKLLMKKKEIEDSRVVLTSSEFEKRISDYNIEKNDFESKIEYYNNYIQSNIEFNENIILKEILKIVENFAIENQIGLVLNENQYFLSSDDINISNIIIKKLNKTNLELVLKDFD